ncbi:hypothetical protein FIBSPDRAFT_730513 [Athelia psychrophila]|uniref:Homeodomain-like protein n=1 Tax=Athelia psychrophila TaxID=1759441 RepID=A0A166QZ47_9AGAM|nr:hypothetical protein FIBSPDRAFT_730513 [Fibularhizoctonia sp. CBS 109695]
MSAGNRRYINPAQKDLIVSMAAHMSSAEIAKVTHISWRTVYQVVTLWQQTGKVERKKVVSGPSCELDSGDVAYLIGMIGRTSDLYQSELRNALLMMRGINAHETTISRTLARNGYTRKKVWHLCSPCQ